MDFRFLIQNIVYETFKFKSQDSLNLDQENNSVVIDYYFFLFKVK